MQLKKRLFMAAFFALKKPSYSIDIQPRVKTGFYFGVPAATLRASGVLLWAPTQLELSESEDGDFKTANRLGMAAHL
jgi:hypothetical protein